jgi:hypothetical protein
MDSYGSCISSKIARTNGELNQYLFDTVNKFHREKVTPGFFVIPEHLLAVISKSAEKPESLFQKLKELKRFCGYPLVIDNTATAAVLVSADMKSNGVVSYVGY